MMNLLRFLSAAGALILAVAPAFPIIAPTAAYANTAVPEKLWDGFSSPVGMAFDAAGNLFVAEWSAGRVYASTRPATARRSRMGFPAPPGRPLALMA
ncbi:hypothetical protein Q9314_24540 (plasmid) [Shinella sumterensis]|nr:hypothetical protein Q9314_24540 [Shinella sumterensis]